jgi:hypothetical protein
MVGKAPNNLQLSEFSDDSVWALIIFAPKSYKDTQSTQYLKIAKDKQLC